MTICRRSVWVQPLQHKLVHQSSETHRKKNKLFFTCRSVFFSLFFSFSLPFIVFCPQPNRFFFNGAFGKLRSQMVSSCCFVNFIFWCIVQKKLTFIVVVEASVVRTQKLMEPVLWDFFFLNREVKFKKDAFLKTPSDVWTRSKSLFVSLLFVCLCCRLRFNLKWQPTTKKNVVRLTPNLVQQSFVLYHEGLVSRCVKESR